MNGTAAAPAGVPQPPQPPPAAPPALNGTAAPSPVSKAPSEAPLPVSKDSKANVVDKPVDEESKKGRFGWFDIEKVSWETFAHVSVVLYYLILERTKRKNTRFCPYCHHSTFLPSIMNDSLKVYLPFIFRYTTEKYTSVRMVERKLLNRFDSTQKSNLLIFKCYFFRFLQVLPPEVNSCTCIRSYYITGKYQLQ